jgi:oligosaccharide repeat unit polymerase
MLYILIWVIVLALSIYLFRYSAGTLSILKLNLLSITFYYSLFVTCFIGTLLIVLNVDQFYMLNKLVHQEYRVIGFWSICFVMVMMPLSMAGVSNIIGFDANKEYQFYLDKPIQHIGAGRKEFFWFFSCLSAISLLAIMYTIFKSPQIPIFELLKGSSDVTRLRIEAGREFGGNVLIRNIFAITLTPLLSLIAYIFTVLTYEVKWRILFLVLLAGAIFISVYDLSKSPIFFYILMFILVRIMIGKTKLTWVKVITIGSLATAALVFIYVFISDVNSLNTFLSYNKGPIGRLILSQISPTFLHLDIYSNSLPFLHGRSFPALLTNLYDAESVRSARVVMAQLFPDRVENGTAGVLNTLFVGEAYANFGYLGILLGTIYIGVLVQIIYIVFIRLPKNPVFVCLFVYFSVNIPRTIVGGFTDFLFNTIWILIVFLFGGLLLFLRVKQDLFQYFKAR